MDGLTSRATGFSIETPSFQGPFELVLDLIEARKLLVNDLALSQVTDDFIAHIKKQEVFPMEQAANFITIAATLLLIKSKSLIPDLALTDEEQGDVEDLKRRLAAYERLREAAHELGRIFGRRVMLPSGERAPEVAFAPARDLSSEALKDALARVLAAREEVEQLPETRVKPMVTIEQMMDELRERVQKAVLTFSEFSKSAKEKVEIIVSFLALLELVKQGAVAAEQYNQHGDIRISHLSASSAPHYG